MAFAGMIQAAIGIERRAERCASRQAVLGAIDREHRQALPGVFFSRGPNLVNQANGVIMHLFEGCPRQFGACLGDGAAVDGLRFRPQPAATGLTEKGSRFTINALTFTISCQG